MDRYVEKDVAAAPKEGTQGTKQERKMGCFILLLPKFTLLYLFGRVTRLDYPFWLAHVCHHHQEGLLPVAYEWSMITKTGYSGELVATRGFCGCSWSQGGGAAVWWMEWEHVCETFQAMMSLQARAGQELRGKCDGYHETINVRQTWMISQTFSCIEKQGLLFQRWF